MVQKLFCEYTCLLPTPGVCLCVKVVRNIPGHPSTKKSWSHKWWEMVPTHIQISTHIHWFIDRSMCHGRYRHRPSIHLRENTVDIATVNPPSVDIDIDRRSTYGKIWSIVDRRWNMEILLWSIWSTRAVESICMKTIMQSFFIVDQHQFSSPTSNHSLCALSENLQHASDSIFLLQIVAHKHIGTWNVFSCETTTIAKEFQFLF